MGPLAHRIESVEEALAFIERHGVVLMSGRGPVANLVEAIAGEPVRGSWWGHPLGKRIYALSNQLDDSPDVLAFRLVGGKITWVHRRLWPALARLADRLGKKRTAAVRSEHTSSGAHRSIEVPFPRWARPEVLEGASRLSEEEAADQLGIDRWESA